MAMDESATATDMRTADAEYMEMAIQLQHRSVGGVEIDFLCNSGNSLFHSRLAKLFENPYMIPKTVTTAMMLYRTMNKLSVAEYGCLGMGRCVEETELEQKTS